MTEESTNPTDPKTDASNEMPSSELTIWDNTPEEEQREIEAFMEWAWSELEATLPPYDWGDDPPEYIKSWQSS